MSEAGQKKYFYCMSITAKTVNSNLNDHALNIWKEDERWEINIGKKHYKVTPEI